MATRPSRAYKLKLSADGIALFLDCHHRLCQIARDLLPYGTTLRVSVLMLEAMPAEELVSLLEGDKLVRFIGNQIRFVGTSPSLAEVTAQLVDRAVSTGRLARAPRTWLLFIAALSCMRAAQDAVVLRIYEPLAAKAAEGFEASALAPLAMSG